MIPVMTWPLIGVLLLAFLHLFAGALHAGKQVRPLWLFSAFAIAAPGFAALLIALGYSLRGG